MSDLKTYLAAKYGNDLKSEAILARAAEESGGGLAKRRKKKRKVDSTLVVASGGGLVIADDDGAAWGAKAEDEDEEAAPVVEERRGHFKPASSNSWATVRPADPSLARTPTPEPEDEAPVVVASRGGLQSVQQLRAENDRRDAEQLKKKREAARELAAKKQAARDRGEDDEDVDDPTATVYRDSSGRKIDVKLEKAAKAKEKRDEIEREMKKMEWGKGLVQKEDVERQKREQAEMKFKPLARYADDEDMNNELKDRDRWNDPAANFLTKDPKKEKKNAPRFPKYAGPAPPPNRFGIPPGYRWDGVDRSNGFEATFMQRGNAGKMRAAESHAWSTSEM
ncbi:hypothetical protein RQP46_007312 [Phenoliferia psychrophenolica]